MHRNQDTKYPQIQHVASLPNEQLLIVNFHSAHPGESVVLGIPAVHEDGRVEFLPLPLSNPNRITAEKTEK
jgi:hypothetical protein